MIKFHSVGQSSTCYVWAFWSGHTQISHTSCLKSHEGSQRRTSAMVIKQSDDCRLLWMLHYIRIVAAEAGFSSFPEKPSSFSVLLGTVLPSSSFCSTPLVSTRWHCATAGAGDTRAGGTALPSLQRCVRTAANIPTFGPSSAGNCGWFLLGDSWGNSSAEGDRVTTTFGKHA